jgi:hypothetical protein
MAAAVEAALARVDWYALPHLSLTETELRGRVANAILDAAEIGVADAEDLMTEGLRALDACLETARRPESGPYLEPHRRRAAA